MPVLKAFPQGRAQPMASSAGLGLGLELTPNSSVRVTLTLTLHVELKKSPTNSVWVSVGNSIPNWQLGLDSKCQVEVCQAKSLTYLWVQFPSLEENPAVTQYLPDCLALVNTNTSDIKE